MTMNAIPYDQLNSLWRLWLDQSGGLAQSTWLPLDKWLKNHFRDLARDAIASQKGKSKKGVLNTQSKKEINENQTLGLWMFSAMRYLQFACACEAAFKQQDAIDWVEWDKAWNLKQLSNLAPTRFWLWIALRENGIAKTPRGLPDADERVEWFQKNLAFWQSNSAKKLLWHGLRPSFEPFIQERQLKSQWVDSDLDNFLRSLNQQPPLWLRPQKEISVDELLLRLKEEGVNVTQTENNLFASGGSYLMNTQVFQQGLVEIQDLASQQIAERVAVKSGDKVWDACAGAGGKSLAIAARMNNKGALIATDLHGYKLEELKRRAKRAEIHNLRTFEWDAEAPLRLPKEIAQQQGFNWVLVDAPCSSSGTWRRNPDARWRFNEKDTQELIQLQQKILSNAAPAVKENGFLVYATCSWQVSENEEQVDWFLQQHPNFELIEQTMLGSPFQNSDAMFVAVFKKK